MYLIVALEYWLCREQLEHNASEGTQLERDRFNDHTNGTHPALHMSTSAPYTVVPRSNSGGRYHKVITRLL